MIKEMLLIFIKIKSRNPGIDEKFIYAETLYQWNKSKEKPNNNNKLMKGIEYA